MSEKDCYEVTLKAGATEENVCYEVFDSSLNAFAFYNSLQLSDIFAPCFDDEQDFPRKTISRLLLDEETNQLELAEVWRVCEWNWNGTAYNVDCSEDKTKQKEERKDETC